MSPQTLEKKSNGQQGIAPRAAHDFWSEIDHLRERMNQWFNSFPFDVPQPAIFKKSDLLSTFKAQPVMNMMEEGNSLVVEAEIPGFDKKDVEVNVHDGVLSIKAERKSEKEEKKEGYYLRERHEGHFTRAIRLPREIDPAKVKASYRDGVLRVEMPLTESARNKGVKVEIK